MSEPVVAGAGEWHCIEDSKRLVAGKPDEELFGVWAVVVIARHGPPYLWMVAGPAGRCVEYAERV